RTYIIIRSRIHLEILCIKCEIEYKFSIPAGRCSSYRKYRINTAVVLHIGRKDKRLIGTGIDPKRLGAQYILHKLYRKGIAQLYITDLNKASIIIEAGLIINRKFAIDRWARMSRCWVIRGPVIHILVIIPTSHLRIMDITINSIAKIGI